MTSQVPFRRRLGVPLRRRTDVARRRLRRGVYIIPSLFTLANMFCGYACVIFAIRGEYTLAAPFIGFAIVLDMLDGRIARLTGTASEFGVQFDSMADVISFGLAPAILSFQWGLASLGRLGWAAAFLFVTAAALRLARFNIQSGSLDKRYFVGLPSPAAAGVPAATVFAYPQGLHDVPEAVPALLMVLVPALLMVSTVRYRSFKTVDLQARRTFRVLILFAVFLILLAWRADLVLVVMAYTYLVSPFVGMAWARVRRRPPETHHAAKPVESGAPPDTELPLR
ncbi:MAG TPA: CDP-diacylglycerol--serine O-phosphatidyltransferase [Vicinamibacterales bacterium]|nr:CDP-diacylglycerol--serine O-phosphatidyltransferase [Vicinamibacterales bacterium]